MEKRICNNNYQLKWKVSQIFHKSLKNTLPKNLSNLTSNGGKLVKNIGMMMMMMNCFCGMVDRRKAFSLISSRDHCQRSSPSRISDTPRAGFEPAQNLSSDFVEWSCAVVRTATPRSHYPGIFLSQSIFRLQGIFIIPYQTFSQKLHLGRLI